MINLFVRSVSLFYAGYPLRVAGKLEPITSDLTPIELAGQLFTPMGQFRVAS